MNGKLLDKIRVLDFTHVVMGPSAGLILAELGAEVIHVEPLDGDRTRRMKGFGAGFFSFYNRNKKSLAIDLKSEEGKDIIYKLVKSSDVLLENFGPGTFDRLGFSCKKLRALNEKLVYCSLKGFLEGPYQDRIGMDELIQMMGGLAYMTGKPGEPMRAGTSVMDITGGMFAVIGILSALYKRGQTNKGDYIKASLFESCAWLMGQFMACINEDTKSIQPMPERKLVWPVYQLFKSSDKKKIFIGIVSDKQWQRFCSSFDLKELGSNEKFKSNAGRVEHKDYILDSIIKNIRSRPAEEVINLCQINKIPFAEVKKPSDLLSDRHLIDGDHLYKTELENGHETRLPKLPIRMESLDLKECTPPPKVGEHSISILKSIGYLSEDISRFLSSAIIAGE
ncbi:MAG: CaiB/BaiF CoA-transferase family protein [Bacteroidota bacterium]